MPQMSRWNYTLDVSDVFHNNNVPFEYMRDTIVSRIKWLPIYDEDDFTIYNIVEGLSNSQNIREMDGWWNEFYDWADDERVWVNTWT